MNITTPTDLQARMDGPRVDGYHRREIPEHNWRTCNGCPSLRVFDFHYFYCRRLGDHTHPDEWNAGWKRLWPGITWKTREEVPCDLPTVAYKRIKADRA